MTNYPRYPQPQNGPTGSIPFGKAPQVDFPKAHANVQRNFGSTHDHSESLNFGKQAAHMGMRLLGIRSLMGGGRASEPEEEAGPTSTLGSPGSLSKTKPQNGQPGGHPLKRVGVGTPGYLPVRSGFQPATKPGERDDYGRAYGTPVRGEVESGPHGIGPAPIVPIRASYARPDAREHGPIPPMKELMPGTPIVQTRAQRRAANKAAQGTLF